jgi:N6-L-threonylcarbamoyladenine synthase
MVILSIETSCDETAISVVEVVGEFPNATYEVIGNSLFSQVDIHREYGGVFPTLAKREHIATILPMLERALKESKLPTEYTPALSPEDSAEIHTLLSREHGLADQLLTFHATVGKPPINAIAVTNGPGLEPALWVGVNFAKALSHLWQVPVVPTDHMEGHILASIYDGHHLATLQFPAIALLVSGGHTELILMRTWGTYEKIGQTRDDAVGEAFDKVARLLGLPYPGGPEISRLAAKARTEHLPPFAKLPTPMLNSGDFDFSFSGLKTAVRNAVANKTLLDEEKAALARDFEDVVITVLIHKLRSAIEEYTVQSIILGGGVSANARLREAVRALGSAAEYPDVTVYLPDPTLSTDNSIMIALAGHSHLNDALRPEDTNTLRADGNRSL